VLDLQSTALPLISADRLGTMLGAPGVVIVDASWYLPAAGRDPEAEYAAAHIPGAIRLSLDVLSDPQSPLPHMLPTPGHFAQVCEAHGIGPRHFLVVYDGSGVNLSAARVWWTFRVFGHQAVTVLDGGLRSWAAATRPIQVGVQRRLRTGYPVPEIDRRLVVDRATIERIVAGTEPGRLVDCRSAPRFRGEEGEPRPGLRRGHIAGSANIPFTEFTNPDTGLLFSVPVLKEIFAARGLDLHQRLVASCGSGVSACVMALAVETIRAADPGAVGPPVAIYDGSWAEYGKS
jgi:thiosulfate/3-mercaptopyruvate sulfurtransferase